MSAISTPKLLEPFRLGHVQLRNRIVKSAQWLVYAEPDGSIGDRLVAYYETLARGGVGLITVEESVCEYPLGASNIPHIRLDDDAFLPGLRRLAEVIHANGCPAVVQITHAGPAHSPLVDSQAPIAPSRLDPPAEPPFAVARAMSVEDIHRQVENYARAAERVKKAGFEGAELHMAHYALQNSFLSRVQNKRTDEYGAASLENRARFALETIRRTRELVGPEFLLGVRMNGREWGHELGTTVAEATAFAKMFEQAGVDYLQVSAYGYGAFSLCALPELVLYPEPAPEVEEFARAIPDGALLPDAAEIRRQVSIPVSGVGHVDYPAAEKALEAGMVDLICMGRPLLADPELPRKLADGRADQIRECIRCNLCLSDILLASPARCKINPFLGRETELHLEPAPVQKRILVAGAGPAGLEFARVASERGHQVIVYDTSPDLGGLMPMAAFIKGTELLDDFRRVIRWYDRELSRLHVEVHLGRAVTRAIVELVAPDAVVVATGGEPVPPQVAGLEAQSVGDGHHVMSTETLKDHAAPFLHLLGSRMMNRLSRVYLPEVGKRVVVVGGDMAGLEAAEFLSKRGREVAVVEPSENLGAGVPIAWLVRLQPWMASRGIQSFTRAANLELLPQGGLRFQTDGQSKEIQADTVLLVSRYKKNGHLAEELKGAVSELHFIGDATGEGDYVHGAILSGARLGLKI